MVNYWIQFGVDGFRFDVINLISKDEFKNSEAIGNFTLMAPCSPIFT